MSRKCWLPKVGEFVGQVAYEWNILHQWNGKKWEHVKNFMAPDQPSGFIRLDVEDKDPAMNAVDRAFAPRTSRESEHG